MKKPPFRAHEGGDHTGAAADRHHDGHPADVAEDHANLLFESKFRGDLPPD
jgi:hypothetical protein